MSNSIYWLTPANTTLVLVVPKYWTWDEMGSWFTDISHQLDLRESPMTVVVDFQKSTFIPQNVIKNIKRTNTSAHPMLESLILTNLTQTHRAVLNMVCRLYPKYTSRWVIKDTLEEVIAMVSS